MNLNSLKHQRYSKIPFPPYRFIPGENPHPTENPLGHSFSKKEAALGVLTPGNWSKNERYLFGADLYNHAYWWESHEAWESLWRTVRDEEVSYNFLQGLIKISAAFLKWHLRQEKGVKSHYLNGRQHLESVRKLHPDFMGVSLPPFLLSLERHFGFILSLPIEWKDPLVGYPYITLKNLPRRLSS